MAYISSYMLGGWFWSILLTCITLGNTVYTTAKAVLFVAADHSKFALKEHVA